MSLIEDQYDAYPYPERDPADEAKRLITGSPSHPLEIDHFLFAGRRDWSQPFRALVAGGGTGDALIQMAQILANAGRSYDITYMDLSVSARGIAEARAAARGLEGITFITGSLLPNSSGVWTPPATGRSTISTVAACCIICPNRRPGSMRWLRR